MGKIKYRNKEVLKVFEDDSCSVKRHKKCQVNYNKKIEL